MRSAADDYGNAVVHDEGLVLLRTRTSGPRRLGFGRHGVWMDSVKSRAVVFRVSGTSAALKSVPRSRRVCCCRSIVGRTTAALLSRLPIYENRFETNEIHSRVPMVSALLPVVELHLHLPRPI